LTKETEVNPKRRSWGKRNQTEGTKEIEIYTKRRIDRETEIREERNRGKQKKKCRWVKRNGEKLCRRVGRTNEQVGEACFEETLSLLSFSKILGTRFQQRKQASASGTRFLG